MKKISKKNEILVITSNVKNVGLKLFLTFLFIFFGHLLHGQEKQLTPNFNSLKTTHLSEFGFVSRKDALTNLKPTSLSLMVDLRAGFKEDYSTLIKINQEKILFYQHLDYILKDTNLFYHLDNKTLFISSEWHWLTIEDSYLVEYDVTNLYNDNNSLKELLFQLLLPFEMVKCKFEVKFTNSKQFAIIGNQYIHFYIRSIITNLKKPVRDYSEKSLQLIFSAETYFEDKPLKISAGTLSAKEWLVLVGQLNNIKINFNNIHIANLLNETTIKIENEFETTCGLLKKITDQLKIKIHFQNEIGIFFDPDNMVKLSPIQKVQCKVYNIKHLTKKLNGSFICQNIKDEIKKEIWVYPENQIVYYKHLEAIIIICPPIVFPEIDDYFFQLSKKTK